MSRLLYVLNPWRNSRLQTYVMLRCLRATLMSLSIIACLIFLVDFVDISKSLGVRGDLPSFTILGLMLLRSPNTIVILLPFAFLSGSIIAFTGLNRTSELIAMRAAGISAWRFITPAMILSFILGVINVAALNPIAASMGAMYEHQRDLIEQTLPSGANGLYLRQGDDKIFSNRIKTVIRAQSQSGHIGHLNNVTIWSYGLDKTDRPNFIERIDAKEATLVSGHWLLVSATVSKPALASRTYSNLSIPSNLDPQKAFKMDDQAQTTPIWRLPSLIAQTDASGFSSTNYRLKWHQLLATPLMFMAMAALGAVFSLRLMRLGGIVQLVIYGVSLGFGVFFLNQILSAMGRASVIPVELAGWSPAIMALLLALTLLVYTEDG